MTQFKVSIPKKMLNVLNDMEGDSYYVFKDTEGRKFNISKIHFDNHLKNKKILSEDELFDIIGIYPKNWFSEYVDKNEEIKLQIKSIVENRPFENNIVIFIEGKPEYIIKQSIYFDEKDPNFHGERFHLITTRQEESLNEDLETFLFRLYINHNWKISDFKYEENVDSYIEKIKKYYVYNDNIFSIKHKSLSGSLTSWLSKKEYKDLKKTIKKTPKNEIPKIIKKLNSSYRIIRNI